HPAVVARPKRLAQLELLQLPGGGAGQRGDELDPLGGLVARERPAAVRYQVLRPGTGAAGAHQGGGQFAPLVVGAPADRPPAYRRVRHQGVLRLDGGHVLATGNDHVLLPVGDHQVAVVVEVAAVAGAEPARVLDGCGRFRLVPVAVQVVVGGAEHFPVGAD